MLLVSGSVKVEVRARKHQQQTPSYLPSYTRLGHAIPGSKTVSVGVCVLGGVV